MGRFSQFLTRFTELKKQQAKWKNKSELQAMRGVYMAAGALCSTVPAIGVLTFTGSYTLASLVATAFLGLFIPSSVWLATRHWKRRYRTVIEDDGQFNWRMYLEDEYEDRIRRIENLGLSKKAIDALKLEAYKELQDVLTQFQVSMASRSGEASTVAIDEVESILEELKNNPQTRQIVEREVDQFQKRLRG